MLGSTASGTMAEALGYDSSKLEWDELHIQNKENKYCYCGTEWRDTEFSAHCGGCKNWFHSSCMDSSPKSIVPFVTNYKFTCKYCGKGKEEFIRTDGNFKGTLAAAVANLTRRSNGKDGDGEKPFHVKTDIVPFVEQHWDALWGRQKTKAQKWATTVVSTMARHPDMFNAYKDDGTTTFTLVDKSFQKLTPLFVGTTTAKRKGEEIPSRRTKRMTKEKENDGAAIANTASNTTSTHPFNKDGYMYTLAEEDPYTAGAYRHARSELGVTLSQNDRAPQLKLSDDRLTITGEKGYCMARASHGVRYGTWFYEAEILPSEPLPDLPAGHTRIGWASRHGHLQGPCGYDCFSYGWRDIEGTKFHLSRGQPYGAGYGPGDVLGFLIDLPREEVATLLPMRTKEEKPIIYKGNVYFEEKLSIDKTKIKQTKRSKIICYKNGVCQGVMFEDLNEGAYFPAVSLYMNSQVRVNFGPDFKYPPTDFEFQAMEEAVYHHNSLLTMADLVGKVDFGIQQLEIEEKQKQEAVVAL